MRISSLVGRRILPQTDGRWVVPIQSSLGASGPLWARQFQPNSASGQLAPTDQTCAGQTCLGFGFGSPFRRTPLPRTLLPRTAQNFALFPPLPPPVLFFFSLSDGLLVEFWWCFRKPGPQMCRSFSTARELRNFGPPPFGPPLFEAPAISAWPVPLGSRHIWQHCSKDRDALVPLVQAQPTSQRPLWTQGSNRRRPTSVLHGLAQLRFREQGLNFAITLPQIDIMLIANWNTKSGLM